MWSQMSRSFLLINGVIVVMRLAFKQNCVSEREHDESHRRCRKLRKTANRQLLFMHGQVQSLLARRPRDHTIIKTHGNGSEDVLQHTYDLVESIQKAQTRRRVKATRLNATRGGRMFSPSLPRENANALAASTDSMGNRDETQDGRYTHIFRKEC